MSDRASETSRLAAVLLAPVLGSCLPSGTGLLDALTDSWTETTLEVAEPAISAALLVAGLTAELCRVDTTPTYWEQLELGDALPLSPELDSALGAPRVDSTTTEGNIQVVLEGVRIIDRDNAFLRFTLASSADAYALNVDLLDGRNDAPFAQLRFAVDQSCEGRIEDAVWVSGESRWTDLSGITHTINLPADDGLSVGLNIECGFIPSAGTLSWQGVIEEQNRTIETSDAAEITFDEAAAKGTKDTGGGDSGADLEGTSCARLVDRAVASWPGVVKGGNGEWEVSEMLTVDLRP